jgi:precorrin-6B methylase 2
MRLIKQLIYFLKYYIRANTIYRIDSPILYNLFRDALDDNRNFYAFSNIRKLRIQLSKNSKNIERTDFGTGKSDKSISVKNLLAKSAISQYKGKMLFRIIKWFQPNEILELGTNIGLSACYMAAAHSKSKVITIEGDPKLTELAKTNFENLGFDHIDTVIGTFEEKLPEVLHKRNSIDFFYLDGNHAKLPMFEYINQIQNHVKDKKYLIMMDDIYWSSEMSSLWVELLNDKRFNFKCDLYHWGIIGNMPELISPIKQTLIPTKYKPWQFGFFR